jgi:hypothetical protein
MQEENGQSPRLTKTDITAVAVGVILDGIVEFLRRLNELQQELNNPPDNPETHRRNG